MIELGSRPYSRRAFSTRSLVRVVVVAFAVLAAVPAHTAYADNWLFTGSMNQSRYGHTATLLPDGKVLVVGGWLADTSAELYDPATGIWSVTGSTTGGHRGGHVAVLLPNGKVLVAGGQWPGTLYSRTAEIYDPATGTWTPTGDMTVGRGNGPNATLLPDGTVLVAGGHGDFPTFPQVRVHDTAEIYDPATGTWTPTVGSMSSPHDSHVQELLPDGRVLVASGNTGGGGVTNVSEIYDPATGLFSLTASMITTRSHPRWTSVSLPNGKVLVAGGHFSGNVSAAELYDPATGTWTATGSMTTPREFHAMTLLPGGQVLAAGGGGVDAGGGYSRRSSAELYDPNSGTWSSVSSMAVPRQAASATVLPSGVVLVAAGFPTTGTAELYESSPSGPPDTDGDGVSDDADAFPNDPSETADSDGDGVGDNGDAFPNDPGETADSDGDGVGDNGDAFPNDPSETADSDGDGVGDNGDAFPNDPSETADSDGDGVGDNGDAFPNDPNETTDSDGDGVGDNGDPYPNSDTSPTVIVGGTNTGVENRETGPGTTLSDLVNASADSCGAGAKNHGAFVSCMSHALNDLRSQGAISGRDRGAIQSSVAKK
jgi:hypothetical protein